MQEIIYYFLYSSASLNFLNLIGGINYAQNNNLCDGM